MAYSNGKLPSSALATTVGGYKLRKDAAAALNALDAFVLARYGRHLNLSDGYRVIGSPGDLRQGRWSQWAAWERMQQGGNLAARPGTSNHGLGINIDLGDIWSRQIIDKHGADYGWSKSWSDAPSEWWHITFRADKVKKKLSGDPVLKLGSKSGSVVTLKKLLYSRGIRNFSGAPSKPNNNRYSLIFGTNTKKAVQRFQRSVGMSGDGIVGPATWRKLRS